MRKKRAAEIDLTHVSRSDPHRPYSGSNQAEEFKLEWKTLPNESALPDISQVSQPDSGLATLYYLEDSNKYILQGYNKKCNSKDPVPVTRQIFGVIVPLRDVNDEQKETTKIYIRNQFGFCPYDFEKLQQEFYQSFKTEGSLDVIKKLWKKLKVNFPTIRPENIHDEDHLDLLALSIQCHRPDILRWLVTEPSEGGLGLDPKGVTHTLDNSSLLHCLCRYYVAGKNKIYQELAQILIEHKVHCDKSFIKIKTPHILDELYWRDDLSLRTIEKFISTLKEIKELTPIITEYNPEKWEANLKLKGSIDESLEDLFLKVKNFQPDKNCGEALCAISGAYSKVKKLAPWLDNVNYLAYNGRSLLHEAACSGSLEIFTLLKQHRADFTGIHDNHHTLPFIILLNAEDNFILQRWEAFRYVVGDTSGKLSLSDPHPDGSTCLYALCCSSLSPELILQIAQLHCESTEAEVHFTRPRYDGLTPQYLINQAPKKKHRKLDLRRYLHYPHSYPFDPSIPSYPSSHPHVPPTPPMFSSSFNPSPSSNSYPHSYLPTTSSMYPSSFGSSTPSTFYSHPHLSTTSSMYPSSFGSSTPSTFYSHPHLSTTSSMYPSSFGSSTPSTFYSHSHLSTTFSMYRSPFDSSTPSTSNHHSYLPTTSSMYSSSFDSSSPSNPNPHSYLPITPPVLPPTSDLTALPSSITTPIALPTQGIDQNKQDCSVASSSSSFWATAQQSISSVASIQTQDQSPKLS